MKNLKKLNELQFVKVDVNVFSNAESNVKLNKNNSYDFKEKISNGKLKPTSNSIFKIFCRCFESKNSNKYAYFEKISNHYERNYDVKQIIVNFQKTSILFDFTFMIRKKKYLNFIDAMNSSKIKKTRYKVK
jgi:hypothetical protein